MAQNYRLPRVRSMIFISRFIVGVRGKGLTELAEEWTVDRSVRTVIGVARSAFKLNENISLRSIPSRRQLRALGLRRGAKGIRLSSF